MSKRRSVLFHGYYGQRNTGDDSFCAIAAWGAKKYWDIEHTGFLCRNMPVLPVPAKQVISDNSFFKGQSAVQAAAALVRGTPVVLAGGSTLHRISKGFNTRNLIRFFNMLGITPLGAIGVSLGPFQNSNAEQNVREFLCRFSFLTLRDRRSYEIARNMRLPYEPVRAFDLAGVLPEVYGAVQHQAGEKKVLGVTLCHYESTRIHYNTENEYRRESKILTVLRQVARSYQPAIRFFVFNANDRTGDVGLTEQTAEAISEETDVKIFPYSRDPGEVWRRFGMCDAFFSTRLHSGIFSCMAEVPFLQVEYHAKCTDFLNDAGVPDQWRIGDMEKEVGHTTELLGEQLEKGRSCFKVNTELLKQKARENFTSVEFFNS